MTAGNNGTPENDDPFAYLYRSDGGEAGAAAPEGATIAQPGVPRTSYNQVQRVGERRQQAPGGYGYPQQQPGYAQPQQVPQQDYGQQPAAAPAYAPQPGGQAGHRAGGSRGGGPGLNGNRKGLLIGAIAVVAAVAIGVGIAIANGDSDSGKNKAGGGPSASAGASTPQPSQSSQAEPAKFKSKTVDAATLTLAGGAAPSTQWPGANAAGGTYVDHMNAVGASATWSLEVPKAGQYTLFVLYGNAGPKANATMTVNGEKQSNLLNLDNFAHATDWSKGWTKTYAWITLKQGANTVMISCEAGDQCGFNLDQVQLKEGQVQR